MSVRNFFARASGLFVLTLACPLTVHAGEFQCSIKSVLRLSDTGSFVRHNWSANYLNREFTVERETGKVLMTTALKQRLINYDKNHTPIMLSNDGGDNSLKAITLYEDTGQYALLEIRDVPAGNQRPFFYHTGIGMILAGICKE